MFAKRILPILTCLLLFALATVTHAQDETPITPDNAHLLEEIASYGQGSPYEILWSPDGNYIVLSAQSGISVYDANDLYAEPPILPQPTGASQFPFFVDDHTLIVYSNLEVHTWDIRNFERINIAEIGTSSDNYAIDIADSAPNIVAYNSRISFRDQPETNIITVRDTATQSIIFLQKFTGEVNFTLNNAGTQLVVAETVWFGTRFRPTSEAQKIKLYDLSTGDYRLLFAEENTNAINIQSLSFTEDQSRIMVHSHINQFTINSETYEQQAITDGDTRYLSEHYRLNYDGLNLQIISREDEQVISSFAVNNLREWAFSDDETQLAVVTPISLQTWNVQSGALIAYLPLVEGNSGQIFLTDSADDFYYFVGEGRIYSVLNGEPQILYESTGSHLDFDPDTQTMVYRNQLDLTGIYYVLTDKLGAPYQIIPPIAFEGCDVQREFLFQLSEDATQLAIAQCGTLYVYRLDTMELIHQIAFASSKDEYRFSQFYFSADNSRAIINYRHTIYFVDIESNSVRTLHSATRNAIDVNIDGNIVAIPDPTYTLFDWETGEEISELTKLNYNSYPSISYDNFNISYFNTVLWWNADNTQLTTILVDQFPADETQLALSLVTWEVASGEIISIVPLELPDYRLQTVNFDLSSDQNLLLLATTDEIILWDATTGNIVHHIEAGERLYSATFNPQMTSIFTREYGIIHRYGIPQAE